MPARVLDACDAVVAEIATEHREGVGDIGRCVIDLTKIEGLFDGGTLGGITKSPQVMTE